MARYAIISEERKQGELMTENQLDELMELHANAIIDHIKRLVKDKKKITKTSIYAMLDELKKYKSDVSNSTYVYEKTKAIDAIDDNYNQLEVLSCMQAIAVELVNYGNQDQKARFVDLVANSDSPEGLDYSCNYTPIIHDGNNSFDI